MFIVVSFIWRIATQQSYVFFDIFIIWMHEIIIKKQILQTKNFFPWFNIKVIGNDFHTSVYDKRDDFGFPIVNFPCLSDDVPRLPSYGVNISQLVRFARCCTSVSDFNSKNLQLTSKLLTQGYRYHKLRKNSESSSGHTLTCCLNLVKYRSRICYGRNLSPGLLRWFSLQTKEGQMWSEFRLVGL